MANSHERKPFRPLGLRMLNLSRQIIQNYAATDPIARQLLPRAMEEPNYEPLSWDEGDDFVTEEPQAPDFETYEAPYPDTEPNRPQKSRPARASQPAQAPVQRKADNRPAKPTQAPQSNQPAQPAPASSQGANPKKLVDVGGVKVPEHVVQAFRNFQAREAQKAENRQKLNDEAGQMDKDSILAKRQQRGRGMSVNYVATDSLRTDDGNAAPSRPAASESSSESDDDSHSDAVMSNSPPVDAPIQRDMVEDDADYEESSYDYESESNYSSYQTDSADVATMPQSGQPIQRTPDYSAFDANSDDSDDSGYDDISYQSDYDNYSSASPTQDSPTVSRGSRSERPIQRTPDTSAFDDRSDVSDASYDDFGTVDSSSTSDFSAPETPSVSRTSRNAKPIQRQTDASNTPSDTPKRSKRLVQRQIDDSLYNDFAPQDTGSDVDAPVRNTSTVNRQIQRDFNEDSGDNDFAADISSNVDTPASNQPTISRKRSSKQPIQRQPDSDNTDEVSAELYSDFETTADSSSDITPASNQPTISRKRNGKQPVQRQSDFEAEDTSSDLYSDFEAADTTSNVDMPVSSTVNRQIQREADYGDDADLYSDFESTEDISSDITPASNQPTINRKRSSKQPIQREVDYGDDNSSDLYSDFGASDTGDNIDTPVSNTPNTPTINRKRNNKQSIQHQPDFDIANDSDLYSDFSTQDAGGDFDAPVSSTSSINRQIQREVDYGVDDSSDLYSDYEAADTDFDTPASKQPTISRNRDGKQVQRKSDNVDSDYHDFSEEVSPPLSGPVIDDSYFDFSLQTDRMRPITDSDIAAYDARKAKSRPSTDAPIQRSADEDSGYGYDAGDYDYADDSGQMDVHQALYSAGAVDTPPNKPRIQRSASLYDDLAAERTQSDGGQQMDVHQALYNAGAIATPPDRPSRGKVQRQSLYDDLAPSDTDAVYNTSDGGQSNIQRSADDETSIGTGNLKADLLSLIGLPADTHVEGFNDVFGGGSSSSSSSSTGSNSASNSASSQPIQRQMIERSADQPTAFVQREPETSTTTTSSSSSSSSSSSESSESNANQEEKKKIEQMAQEVYRNIKNRLRVEWERRNRF